MPSDWVKVPAHDGGEFRAYLSTPAMVDGPGLIVLQEIFGVNKHIRNVCDKFAEEGFIVLAPDLFWRLEPNFEVGYEGEDFDRAIAHYPKFDETNGLADIESSINYLRKLPECSGKVGVTGFCLGGKLAYLSAARLKIDAAVSYYGGGIQNHLSEAKEINCPLIMHLGEHDDLIPPDAVAKIQSGLSGNNKVKIYIYEGANHGFNCDERASYNKDSADLAFSRSTGVLKYALKG